MNIDPTGKALISFLIGLAIFALAGAAVGAVGTFASDLVTSAMTGEWVFSSWETYLGNMIGGAVGGVVSFFNPYAGVVIGSTLGTFTGLAIGKATGINDMSWGEVGIFTGVSFVISLITAGFTKHAKIPGITKGSHSFQQVFKTGMTKSLRYVNYNMHMKTYLKGTAYLIVSGMTIGFFVNSALQGIVQRMREVLA